MNKTVAILLVVFNEEHHIPRLIKSLHDQTYKNFDVYAIDNNSKDDSVKKLKEYFSDIKLTLSKKNNGFAKGNNIIAEKAVKDGAEYLFVLNTDMELDKNCISELVGLAESNSQIGGVAPIIMYGKKNKRTNVIQCYVDNVNFQTGKTSSLHSQINFDDKRLPDKMQVNTIHGGTTFIKSVLYKKIGLFNEDNFMYGDELDFAYRIKQAGYKLFVTKKAKCWHFHDWTKKNKKGYYLQYYYIIRNRFLFFHRYKKHCSFFVESIKEIIKLPITIIWLIKTADFKLVKYYYLGMLHGLMDKKGFMDIEFK